MQDHVPPLTETWRQLRVRVPELKNVEDPWQELNLAERQGVLVALWEKTNSWRSLRASDITVGIPAAGERQFGNALREYHYQLGGPRPVRIEQPGRQVPSARSQSRFRWGGY